MFLMFHFVGNGGDAGCVVGGGVCFVFKFVWVHPRLGTLW